MADAVTVRFEGLNEFRATLKRLEPDIAKAFDKRLRTAARLTATEARALASWSSRIPAAIGTTTSKRGVGIRVSKKRAPHAGLYELGSSGNPGQIRHPLFGNRDHWFTTPVRPFLKPAVDRRRDEMFELGLAAVEEAKREVGLT